MKNTLLLTATALVAAFGLAAADSKDDLQPNLPDPDAPVEIRVTSGDANKEIAAKVGEFIVIELDSNATTGYSWSELPGRTDSVLESKGDDYVAQPRPGMLGGGGKAYFRYLVKEAGTAEIKLGYARPWEKDNPPASLFNVKIKAEAAPAKDAAEAADDAKAGKTAPKTYEMTGDDNGKTLKVKVGDVIRVKLKSNRTTGYSWALVGKPDAKVLKSGEVEYKVDEHPAGMVGVGGSDFCTFTALAPGKTEIALGYARPWEKDKEPAQAFRLTVEVEAEATAPAAAGKTFKLGEDDKGKTVRVRAGDLVEITLAANVTTGFSWCYADKVDKDILKLEKDDYIEKDHPAGMVGVGGRTVLAYRALKPGKAKIELTYMQPWEPDSQFNTKYSVTVEVE